MTSETDETLPVPKKLPMSTYFERLGAAFMGVETQTEATAKFWHDKYFNATEELASTTLQLMSTRKENAMSITSNASKPNGTVVVPVDLGGGYVVQIVGLPGRPTKAACERLCKVIMAYAVDAPNKQETVISGDLSLNLEETLKNELSKGYSSENGSRVDTLLEKV